jgi:hypothetical protein
MPEAGIRQLREGQVRRPLAPTVIIDSSLRTRLEQAGVSFLKDTKVDGKPELSDWAALELSAQFQYVLIHPTYEGANDSLYVFTPLREVSPREAAQPFLDWLQVKTDEIHYVYESWPTDSSVDDR